jgi:hypothetical protein
LQSSDWPGATSAGGTANDYAGSIAVDASGNIYMAGAFASSTITFGSITLTNAGGDDMFLAKLGNSAGIDELRNSSNISVFPNPATDKMTIETSGAKDEGNLVIMNIEGQQLITRQITQPKTQIDISSLPSGEVNKTINTMEQFQIEMKRLACYITFPGKDSYL